MLKLEGNKNKVNSMPSLMGTTLILNARKRVTPITTLTTVSSLGVIRTNPATRRPTTPSVQPEFFSSFGPNVSAKLVGGEDDDDSSGVIMVLTFFAVVTIVGNLLLLVCIFGEKAFRTSTNNFVASLTVASLLVGTVIMPLAIYRNAVGRFASNTDSPFVCEIWLYCAFVATTITTFNIVAICFIRYLAIAHPLLYSRGHHRKVSIWAPVVIWPICLLIGSPRLILSMDAPPTARSVCAAGSSLDDASFFVPISSCLFLVGNLAALIMLLLIRRALIKRAAEVVERRYSMCAPDDQQEGLIPENAMAALQALKSALRANDIEACTEASVTSCADSSASGSPGTVGDAATRERRRRWAAAAAKRKLDQQGAQLPAGQQRDIHNKQMDDDTPTRRSEGSVGLETIMSGTSQHASTLTVSAVGELGDSEVKLRTEQLYIIGAKRCTKQNGVPSCASSDRLSVVAKFVIPSSPEVELGAFISGRIHRTSQNSNGSVTPESSPKASRRDSKPLVKAGAFRKAERRLSTSDDTSCTQLMIHRPKSSSIYRRNPASTTSMQLSPGGPQSQQPPVSPTKPLMSVAQSLRSASSAISLAVVEQLAGEEIAKHVVNGRRQTCVVETNNFFTYNGVEATRNSYPKQCARKAQDRGDKERSRSLLTNGRASAMSGTGTTVVMTSSSSTIGTKGRRTSFKSIRSGVGTSVSMAIDGIVEGFVSDGVKATATLIMLVLLFSICGLPSVISELVNFICLHANGRSCVSDSVLHMSMWMSFTYNTLNPLVYFSFNQQLRATLCRCVFKPTLTIRKALSLQNSMPQPRTS